MIQEQYGDDNKIKKDVPSHHKTVNTGGISTEDSIDLTTDDDDDYDNSFEVSQQYDHQEQGLPQGSASLRQPATSLPQTMVSPPQKQFHQQRTQPATSLPQGSASPKDEQKDEKHLKNSIKQMEEKAADQAAALIAGALLDSAVQDIIVGDELSDDGFFENSDFDSDLESSDDNIPERRTIHKVPNYVENTVHFYDDELFRSHFRLQRRDVYDLIDQYQRTDYLINNEPNEPAVTHEKALLLTLFYLANTETFREISNLFDVTMSTAHGVLKNTLNFINSLKNEYIRWPYNREAKEEISDNYREIQNIDGIIGAIDGCHIRIRRPMEDQRDYYNRKRFHSLVLQATATSNYIITDVHIGELGATHDARVLRRSPLYQAAHEDNNFFDGYYLIGDSAYPDLPWLVTPFRDDGQLTAEQRDFNSKHSSTRIRIEHVFGFLKGRFRRLQKFNNLLLDLIVECIMAACILHNILTLRRNNEPEFDASSNSSSYFSDTDVGFSDSDD